MPNSPDDPSLSPWLPRQPLDADRLDRWQGRTVMDVRTGPGLLSTRKGNSVTIALATPGPKPLPPIALVNVTGNASGGGKYTGTMVTRPTTGPAATGNLSGAELGTAGTVVRIVNLREVGLATHDLDASGTYLPTAFIGYFLGTAADGVAVYAIDGRQSEDCA